MLQRLINRIPVNPVYIVWVVTGLVLMGISLYMFTMLSTVFVEKSQFPFDQKMIDVVRSFSSPIMDWFMIFITEIGSPVVMGLLLVIGMTWIIVKHKNFFGMLGYMISVAGAGLLNLLLKGAFERERPNFNRIVEADGFSFPSGHSMGSMVFFGFLGYLVIRSNCKPVTKIGWGILFSMIILFIGISRIYLGVHFPSDVLAGYTAGIIWLILCIAFLEVLYFLKGKENKERRESHE